MNLAQQPSGSPRRISPPQPGRLMLLPPTRILAEEAEEFLSLSDLRQFAVALTGELDRDPARALFEPASWYREAVDPRCSLEQALLLREMTVELCREASLLLQYQKEHGAPLSPGRMEARSEMLNGVSFIAVLVVLLWLVPAAANALWGGK